MDPVCADTAVPKLQETAVTSTTTPHPDVISLNKDVKAEEEPAVAKCFMCLCKIDKFDRNKCRLVTRKTCCWFNIREEDLKPDTRVCTKCVVTAYSPNKGKMDRKTDKMNSSRPSSSLTKTSAASGTCQDGEMLPDYGSASGSHCSICNRMLQKGRRVKLKTHHLINTDEQVVKLGTLACMKCYNSIKRYNNSQNKIKRSSLDSALTVRCGEAMSLATSTLKKGKRNSVCVTMMTPAEGGMEGIPDAAMGNSETEEKSRESSEDLCGKSGSAINTEVQMDIPEGDNNLNSVKGALDGLVQTVVDNQDLEQYDSDNQIVVRKNTKQKKICRATKCASAPANIFQMCRLPKRFRRLPEEIQEKIKSTLGISDPYEQVCKKCYNGVHKMISQLTVDLIIPSSSGLASGRKNPAVKNNSSKKVFACGWCKFRAINSSSVVRHHYKMHDNKELDVVRLKSNSPKQGSARSIGFNCDSCNFSGRFRHQMHLHNDRFHQNSLNRDGTTDYESDSVYTPVYPYFYYNKSLPENYSKMQENYKLKEVIVVCQDLFQLGMDGLLDIINNFGIRKLCVDRLTENEFIGIARRYRDDVSYVDTLKDQFEPINLTGLDDNRVAKVIRQ